MQGNRWPLGGKWGAFSTQFVRRSREGNRLLEFRIPVANAFTGPLPRPMHGARALPSVSCVACWNEQRALGFCRGPFVFRGSQGPSLRIIRKMRRPAEVGTYELREVLFQGRHS